MMWLSKNLHQPTDEQNFVSNDPNVTGKNFKLDFFVLHKMAYVVTRTFFVSCCYYCYLGKCSKIKSWSVWWQGEGGNAIEVLNLFATPGLRIMIRHWVSAVFRGNILYTFFTLLILLLPLGYSPLWALTCRTMPLHFSIFSTNSLHLLTPIFTLLITENKYVLYTVLCRSQWPRRLRRGSAAARLLWLWIESHRGVDVCLL
jgi:hypothetical protein